ncbi:UDP-glucuronosyltransferase 2C1 [Nasonia vitripennis]|uniref:UDP-glucuronosyltransferase n=1 Tax=Nasonia vitripennis TaxID=7425 RepID=A0A7M7LM00_NASVI|nr:UDP-glucuronosyltransferase 2C1 [Nasonia vitripennis]
MLSTQSKMLTILIVLACSSQSIDGLRILGLFPLHGKSHFVMCERLVKHLAQQGHQLDVYSHFPFKKPIPNHKDFSLNGTLPAVVNNMTYDFFKQFQSVDMAAMMSNVGNPVCELLSTPVFQDLFKSLEKNQPYDLVIIEVFVSNCFLAWGRRLNVPMIGVMTSTLIDWYNEPLGNPFNPAATPGCWSGLFHPMNFWERLINTIMYHMISAQFNYHIKAQNKYVEQHFGHGYPDVTELPRDLDLLLVNTHHSLDGVRAFTPAIIPVGGLHIVDDGEKLPEKVLKWLDESKDGCIYFSFGSMVRIETFPKPILAAIYATFKNIAPVRVLMKIAKPEDLPPGLPSNVMTQSWFSQLQVLKHKNIKAFVTHGGLMSTQESLYAGVPMIGVPLFGDQHLNVRVQARQEIAVFVNHEEITEQSFTAAVKEILNNPIYKKNAESFSKKFFDRPMSPIDTATFWIEYVARHGKNALRSPVVDMPWWQVNLIDVYGFILLVLIIIGYIIKVVVKKILKFCCSSKSEDKRSKKAAKKIQ